MVKRINKTLFAKASGIRLDIGAGQFKQKGFLAMDIERHPSIDIVHDIQKFPWPVPDNSCFQILMSHTWEHIEPKYRFRVMDELWRICRYDGQLLIACPHAGSFLEAAHPAHYMCPNEATFQFFDPDYQLYHSSGWKKPLPWKILRNDPNLAGCIEIILEPRKDRKGKPMTSSDGSKVKDMVKVEIRNKKDKNNAGTDDDNQKRQGRESKK